MSHSPLVSIIMNCFDGEKYLRDAIDSVIAQTYTNWELIFWDNQSIDKSAEIINSYKDKRIRYYYASHHTLLYEARNLAVQKASGSFLAFLDVDDYWLPNKLEQQLGLFDDPRIALVYGNFWILRQHSGEKTIYNKRLLPEGKILERLLANYTVGLLTLMVRSNRLPSAKQPFDSRYQIIGDFDLVIRMAAKYNVGCIQSPVAIHRIHERNLSTTDRMRHIEELTEWANRMRSHNEIGQCKSLIQVACQYEYNKIMAMVLARRRYEAILLFKRMRLCALKIRIFTVLILPIPIIRLFKK